MYPEEVEEEEEWYDEEERWHEIDLRIQ